MLPYIAPGARVAVAFSGGADSSALLLAAMARWPVRVLALHVHHGLQAAADDFESHARATCERLGLPLQVRRVQARHEPGQSPEDAARLSRYSALAEMASASGAVCVLLGQHGDDQAETLLLALSRGAGLPGLAAMPERFERHGMVFGRPFLGLAATVLREYLAVRGESFVEDPSNTDTRYTRNRIRAVLVPAWQACFPGFRTVLARSARHAAQAQALLDDLARMDLECTGVPPTLSGLQSLSRERQANVLRHWLGQQAGAVPSTAQMDALLVQVAACTTRGHRIHLKVADGFVTRAGPALAYTPPI
ncbi:MAG: tRNA lysidine(34) synthetase TilS [Hydrogenophaga sp.]|nr:tRNA lysidine(34) synthetase TilS [Hydrogenophaga sp.]